MNAPRTLHTWGVAVLAMVAAMAGTLHATAANVPEIDAGSMVTGLGMVSAAVLMLRSRMRRR